MDHFLKQNNAIDIYEEYINVISTRAPRGPGPVLQIYIYPVHNMPSSCVCVWLQTHQ